MTNQRPTLIIATRNPGKLREFKRLLSGLEAELIDLDRAGVSDEVAETGATFEENACIKASAYSAMTESLVLADDSGLEVDALEGAPGVQSARFGGSGLTDRERADLLLERLGDVPGERRGARFRAVLAIAGPAVGPEPVTVEGRLEGAIARRPAGSSGFGYDPVFWLPDRGRMVAELLPAEKDEVSHRGRAARRALPVLRRLLGVEHTGQAAE